MGIRKLVALCVPFREVAARLTAALEAARFDVEVVDVTKADRTVEIVRRLAPAVVFFDARCPGGLAVLRGLRGLRPRARLVVAAAELGAPYPMPAAIDAAVSAIQGAVRRASRTARMADATPVPPG